MSADGARGLRDRLLPWSAAAATAILVAALGACMTATDQSASDARSLAPVESFSAIADPTARSAALFVEVAKVLQHPRCLNCHPVTRSPTQGDDLHAPTSSAGIRSIPGAEHWGLAPASMAWQGLTTGEICQQIQDPARNGDRSLEKIRVHLAEDHLVGWAWHPGEGREPAPGTQEQFGELVTAWIETGAHCPQ
jgi:hypothetical protein